MPAPILEIGNASPYSRILKASTCSRISKCLPLFRNLSQHLFSNFEMPAAIREFWKPAPLLEFWNASPSFRILNVSTYYRILKARLCSNFEMPAPMLAFWKARSIIEFRSAIACSRILKASTSSWILTCQPIFLSFESKHLLSNPPRPHPLPQ